LKATGVKNELRFSCEIPKDQKVNAPRSTHIAALAHSENQWILTLPLNREDVAILSLAPKKPSQGSEATLISLEITCLPLPAYLLSAPVRKEDKASVEPPEVEK